MANSVMVTRLPEDAPAAHPAEFGALVAMMERTNRLHESFGAGFALAPGWEDMQRGWLQRVVGDPHWFVALAYSAGQPAGCVMATIEEHPPILANTRRGYLTDIWVEPEWRRHGVAAALMAAAERWVREQGARRIELLVAANNAAAQALYRALGYEPVMQRWARQLDPDES